MYIAHLAEGSEGLLPPGGSEGVLPPVESEGLLPPEESEGLLPFLDLCLRLQA